MDNVKITQEQVVNQNYNLEAHEKLPGFIISQKISSHFFFFLALIIWHLSFCLLLIIELHNKKYSIWAQKYSASIAKINTVVWAI